jgi:hypothetical protein
MNPTAADTMTSPAAPVMFPDRPSRAEEPTVSIIIRGGGRDPNAPGCGSCEFTLHFVLPADAARPAVVRGRKRTEHIAARVRQLAAASEEAAAWRRADQRLTKATAERQRVQSDLDALRVEDVDGDGDVIAERVGDLAERRADLSSRLVILDTLLPRLRLQAADAARQLAAATQKVAAREGAAELNSVPGLRAVVAKLLETLGQDLAALVEAQELSTSCGLPSWLAGQLADAGDLEIVLRGAGSRSCWSGALAGRIVRELTGSDTPPPLADLPSPQPPAPPAPWCGSGGRPQPAPPPVPGPAASTSTSNPTPAATAAVPLPGGKTATVHVKTPAAGKAGEPDAR